MNQQLEADLNLCQINTHAAGIVLTTRPLDYEVVEKGSYYSITTGRCVRALYCDLCILHHIQCHNLLITLPIIAEHFPHLPIRYPELFL